MNNQVNLQIILTLLEVKGLGNIGINYLLPKIKKLNNDVNDLYDLLIENKSNLKSFDLPEISDIRIYYSNAERIISFTEENEVSVLIKGEDDYPNSLSDLRDSPILIYSRGDKSLLKDFDKNIAIVGTRKPENYSKKCAEKISSFCSENGYNVISGLAIGCDSHAHVGCLDAYGEGKTIAVLPGGINVVQPKKNFHLYQRIIDEGGCIISEMPPGFIPLKFSYVQRNRLQSGLSKYVFIVEAQKKSGTMQTYKFAKKQGRSIGVLSKEVLIDKMIYSGNKFAIEDSAVEIKTLDDFKNFLRGAPSKNLSLF